eukprot:SAG31_NODE_86_length_26973_cov_16.850897_31_plen_67_part_00
MVLLSLDDQPDRSSIQNGDGQPTLASLESAWDLRTTSGRSTGGFSKREAGESGGRDGFAFRSNSFK